MATPVGASSSSAVTAPVVSVAANSSSAAAGGSVINVSSLVSQLVTATFANQVQNITDQTTAVTAQISALGTFKSALSTFQSAVSGLSSPTAFNALAATSSDDTLFKASADATAVPGSYSVSVTQLAQAQQLVSNPFAAGSSAAVGTGTLSISLGTQNFTVTIGSANNTLAGIATAINAAGTNPGVTATIVQGSDGAHLVLASAQTGAANTITVSQSGGDGGLAPLAYSAAAPANYTQQVKPQDATVSIAGVSYDSPSNTVNGAITGVTLNLLKQSATGSSATLSIADDTATVETNINTFVSAYNALMQQFTALGGFDATSGTAGPMMGNTLLTGIQNQVTKLVHSILPGSGGTYNSLASIGITSQKDGTLVVNSAKLENAMSANYAAVSQIFSSANGIATQLGSQLTVDLQSNGPVDSYSKTLVQRNQNLTDQSDALTNQENLLTASMTQQFGALNTLLSALQTKSAYLSQAFANLPGNNNNNNK